MRGRTELEGIHEEAEFVTGILFRQSKQVEHLVLKLGIVNTYATTAELVAIDHHVVGCGAYGTGIGVEEVNVVGVGGGEGVVHSVVSLSLVVPFEEREVDDPKAREFLRVAESETAPHLNSQSCLRAFRVSPTRISMRSPGCAPPRSSHVRNWSSVKNLPTELFMEPSFSSLTHISPLAPICGRFTKSVSWSSCLRV